jgi:DNA-binding NarL/FixJ family response regulator
MAKTRMTYLICYDDHRNFTEDVKKRFSDTSRYQVISFHAKQDFLSYCIKEAENSSCKVAIIGVPDTKEQFESIDELTQEIKKTDPKTGLILLVPPDKMDDLKKKIRFNIDAYVPRNTNAILRIHNTVKKLFSEHNIAIFRKKRNFSLYVLLAFIVIAAVLLIVAIFRFPEYFKV